MNLSTDNLKNGLIKGFSKMLGVFVVLCAIITSMLHPVTVDSVTEDVLIKLNLQQNYEFPRSELRKPRGKILVLATAYSSTPDQTDSTPCITANGFNLCKYFMETGTGSTIAANFLPMSTSIRMPGLFGNKVFVVRDRMNKRYGQGRVDVWFPTRQEAKDFGVRWIEVELL